MTEPPQLRRRLSRSRGKTVAAQRNEAGAGATSLTGVRLHPDDYASDFALLDRFQQFSAELARLAFGGVAAIGVLVPLTFGKGPLEGALFQSRTFIPLLFSLAAFVAAAGTALLHRFLSTDGMFFHLSSLKRKSVAAALPAGTDLDRLTARLDADEGRRERAFKRSERMIFTSAALLVLGVAAFAVALVILFLHGHR